MLGADPAVARTAPGAPLRQRRGTEEPLIPVKLSVPHRDTEAPVSGTALFQENAAVVLAHKLRGKVFEADGTDRAGNADKLSHLTPPNRSGPS